MLSNTTRQEILTMLKKAGSLSVGDIAKELGITEMAVRRHLNALERDQLVETSMVRQSMGRPATYYRLSAIGEHSFPKNYGDLALEFLRDLGEENEELIHALFRRRKERLIKEMDRQLQRVDRFEEKVYRLAELQDQKGYMVKVVPKEDEYILLEHNCPISAIAKQYKEACRCELELFQEVLKTEIKRIDCYAEGENYCSFSIKKPAGNKEGIKRDV
ncbi:putative transcriptional regulator [[Clostridium] ultunense Esp]|nr:putative transcriptional regulator [[Clostridium] ultunense Esp]